MFLSTNISMEYGGEPAPQGKPNSSWDGVTYPWIGFVREKLLGLKYLSNNNFKTV